MWHGAIAISKVQINGFILVNYMSRKYRLDQYHFIEWKGVGVVDMNITRRSSQRISTMLRDYAALTDLPIIII